MRGLTRPLNTNLYSLIRETPSGENMIVIKFGGASLADLRNFQNVATFLKTCWFDQKKIIVVVSAMKDVTDSLMKAAFMASSRKLDSCDEILARIFDRHLEIASVLSKSSAKEKLLGDLEDYQSELKSIFQAVAALQECTPRALDFVLSFGERLSSILLTAFLTENSLPAKQVSGEDLIITDDQFGSAFPLEEITTRQIREILIPLLDMDQLPVVSGFTGKTKAGQITTLGRGGTDFSASIIGSSLNAEEVWFMKEVDGIMSTDPRVVSSATTIPLMSYQEVAELSFFGAKVLHPIAIHPLKKHRIRARIKNVYKHDFCGTMVELAPSGHNPGPKAVTAIQGVCMISVEGDGMIGIPGVAGRAFTSIADKGVNVLMISQTCSEQNICLAVKKEDQTKTIEALSMEFELEILKGHIDRVMARDDVSIISLVGAGMSGVPGIAGKLFSIIGENKINVLMIAQGSSEVNISFLLENRELDAAISCIHEGFELGCLNG